MNKYINRYFILVTLISSSFASNTMAQTTEISSVEPKREKIGLVLSGGGARGLAHLGVLKALEEQRVPIDYIAGTSAGALIGGMYASGLSIQEIGDKIKDMDLTEIAFAPADRRTMKQNVRNLDYQGNSIVDVSITKEGKVTLPISVSNGVRIESVLRDLLKNEPYDVDFEKLPIPFNAVAADLATGKMVVLKKGQLAHALRASMSIPAVFSPVEVDGKLLVDGMIDRNLPIDVARQMGATRIIAVDVGTDLLKKDDLDNVVAVSEQMLSLLVKRNVDEQIATLTDRDILIRPDLGDLGNLEFEKGLEAAKLGYAALEKNDVKKSLIAFSAPIENYNQVMAKHVLPKTKDLHIDFVRIQTHGLARPISLRKEVHMQDGQTFDINTVNADIGRLLSAGRISNVTYSIKKVGDDKTELVYDVTEKDEAHNSIRAGIEVHSNSFSDQQFALHLVHRRIWLNALGGEWRNNLSIGKRTQFTTQIDQPLNSAGSIFIRPTANIGRELLPAYIDGSTREAAEYVINRHRIGFLVGTPIKRIGDWGIGLSNRRSSLRGNNNNPALIIPDDQQITTTFDAELTLDQLDNAFIPTKGYFLHAYARVGLKKQRNRHYFSTGVVSQYSLQHKKHSLSFALEAGGHNNDSTKSLYLSPYSLGGYQRLSGYANNQFIGNYLALTSLTYRYRTPYSILNNPLIIGASLETGNTWASASDIGFRNMKYSGSIFGALNTPIGPAQLAMGLTQRGKVNFYLFLGRTFSEPK